MGESGVCIAGAPLAGEAPIGLYEKALPSSWPWERRLAAAAEAGYRYMEVSIDETDVRLARLVDAGEQRAMRQAIESTGVPLLTMCLSAHRRFPLGSADPAIRERGYEVMRRAIDFANHLGVRIVQVAGYDVYYEPHTTDTVSRYIEGLHRATEWASQAGVMLGLENVDAPITASLHDSMKLVAEMNSPWFQMYADMANVAAAGYDPCTELALCAGHLAAVHVKDGRLNLLRGVAFGTGIVPFEDVFRTLRGIRFCGPMTVEMWAEFAPGEFGLEFAEGKFGEESAGATAGRGDPTPTGGPLDAARHARVFVRDLLDKIY